MPHKCGFMAVTHAALIQRRTERILKAQAPSELVIVMSITICRHKHKLPILLRAFTPHSFTGSLRSLIQTRMTLRMSLIKLKFNPIFRLSQVYFLSWYFPLLESWLGPGWNYIRPGSTRHAVR